VHHPTPTAHHDSDEGASPWPDISPANVVVSSAGAPCLVDFSLATSLAEERSAAAPRSE
jgi:hypothetical protein